MDTGRGRGHCSVDRQIADGQQDDRRGRDGLAGVRAGLVGRPRRRPRPRRGRGHGVLGADGPAPTVGGRAAAGKRCRADGTVVVVVVVARGGADVERSRAVQVVTVVPGLLAQQQRPERVPEVLQVVRVQQRVAGRVEVRQDDARVQQRPGHGARAAERLHAVDRVQRHPAHGEERDDYRQVLRGLHLALAGRAERAQLGQAVAEATAAVDAAAAAAADAVHHRNLFDLQKHDGHGTRGRRRRRVRITINTNITLYCYVY